ncbi:hypothetical protein [Pseudooceanicola nitratireducens]|jgi:hypothetical protein|uniref:hypothetical protein n=1 Tax=Pseudooceanicola nitratireducens TaxID=517719 RepID=UPI001C949986|nr:hypothetical protein [Pseudooceanicola nitratireducens]MBY6157389.1 hypothetical protein [Pseudooceanicola nitratireducens]MEC9104148.1 hypothetical protein [Pseudomonadota bacterium]
MMRIALILLAVLIATPMAEAKGRRAAMSGDTIMLDGKIIKLKGLECPPMDTEEGKEAQRLVQIMLHARILNCAWDTLPDGTREGDCIYRAANWSPKSRSMVVELESRNLCRKYGRT